MLAGGDRESCAAVEEEINKVLSKFSNVNDHSQKSLESAISLVEKLQEDLKNQLLEAESGGTEQVLTDGQKSVILESLRKVKDLTSGISSQHKGVHGSVSKVGKVIDKNFVSDFTPVPKSFETAQEINTLNEVICNHFLRQGRLPVAEALIREGKLEFTEEMKQPFIEMHEIIQGLQERRLAPALSWAERNHEALEKQGSALEFNLHKMNFLLLLFSDRPTAQSRNDALNYSKVFQIFSEKFSKEIQQLMCCFIYQHKGIENSPYAHFVSNDSWQKLEDQFTKDACSLVGLPLESPLAISVNAGAQTLGPLLQITKVMSQKQLSLDWTPKEELPIAVELGHAARFHSVFACPILRRHANDNNPPMKLTCGHVISKDALNQLFHGPKLKCPYCPAEQTLTETMRLHI